jgi:glycosyltransferase involved in cell wall biosynthesis
VENVRRATRIAAPSRSIGARVVREWRADPNRVDFFPNPFQPEQKYLALRPGADQSVVTFVGRLEVRKGVINLARAIPLVLRQVPDARFRFVGSSLGSPQWGVTMLDYLRAMLLPQRAAVDFLGWRPPDELPGLLSDTAVCVFPSFWESFGYVCLEAMAAGRAVVASRNCGLEELLDHGRVGRIIDPRSPDDIAARIIELLGDSGLRRQLGAAARERVLSVYAPQTVAPEQEACYERAIRGAGVEGQRGANQDGAKRRAVQP